MVGPSQCWGPAVAMLQDSAPGHPRPAEEAPQKGHASLSRGHSHTKVFFYATRAVPVFPVKYYVFSVSCAPDSLRSQQLPHIAKELIKLETTSTYKVFEDVLRGFLLVLEEALTAVPAVERKEASAKTHMAGHKQEFATHRPRQGKEEPTTLKM